MTFEKVKEIIMELQFQRRSFLILHQLKQLLSMWTRMQLKWIEGR